VFVSSAVGRLLRWIGEQARRPAAGLATSDLGAGIGQSSWGPTGFALLPSAQRAQQLLDAARAAGVVDPALTLRIAEPLNRGARVIEHPPRRADAAAAQESSARHGSDEAKVDHWPPPQRSHAPARSPQLGR